MSSDKPLHFFLYLIAIAVAVYYIKKYNKKAKQDIEKFYDDKKQKAEEQ